MEYSWWKHGSAAPREGACSVRDRTREEVVLMLLLLTARVARATGPAGNMGQGFLVAKLRWGRCRGCSWSLYLGAALPGWECGGWRQRRWVGSMW
eukprot:3894019-Pyramimonas_sp.AAC.1